MRRFLREEGGVSSVEFALIATLFFLFIFGIIDFGRIMWHWNSAAKAAHWGARYAVVSNMVAPGLFTYDGVVDAGGNGRPVPLGAISPNPVVCDVSACNGYGPIDNVAFNNIVARMQMIYDGIKPANVVVEYRHVEGLGFAGNPFGPDFIPVVTVRLKGMVFTPVTPGLAGFVSLNMPDFATSLTGEDLTN